MFSYVCNPISCQVITPDHQTHTHTQRYSHSCELESVTPCLGSSWVLIQQNQDRKQKYGKVGSRKMEIQIERLTELFIVMVWGDINIKSSNLGMNQSRLDQETSERISSKNVKFIEN